MPNVDEMDLDKERRERMAKNQAMLAELGVKQAVVAARRAAAEEKAAVGTTKPVKPAAARKPRAPPRPKVILPARRSGRLAGAAAPTMVEFDDDGNPMGQAEKEEGDKDSGGEDEDDEGLVEVIGNVELRARAGPGPVATTEEELADLGAPRGTTAQRRGKKLHKRGVCCHFCRQKKLCGEEDCPLCVHNNNKAECIGKSKCSRCMSSNGTFCRACLDCRYGLELEAVRADPNWMCAHCYEQEHGPWEKHGWFCNSSFCMEKKGMKPTGIAIYEARRLGYKSVAHLLQALTKAMTPAELAAIKAAGGQAEEEEEEAQADKVGVQATTGVDTTGGATTVPAVEETEENEKRGRKRKAPEEEEGQTQLEPSSSKGGAELDRSVEAGVELEAVEQAGGCVAAGEQSAEEADGLDVPLLKRRRVGRKEAAAAAEAKAQQQEAAVAACKADEPLATRRRTTRTARART
ncbi:hypothetical protein HXX76_006058 [Chlamydomonas incerta]|uniref:Zinc-finger domain-containing protein n=1 Tax=Chlamydomonas incerta TaxID=51695 RepID=A0A835TFP0_CHLIN|nr:hypothetical protein HXX76_006058 [Chlamydomonas incerta]|eukprot:KAG2437406.1 hypothetical protein HXX76_006058 [Chlamydomonas incerta]